MNVNFSTLNGLIQAVVQDKRTNKVLKVGYLNESTLNYVKNSRQVALWNVKKNEMQPLEGGEYHRPLTLDTIIANEEGDAVIIKAIPEGSTTGADTFLGDKNLEDLMFLSRLQDFVEKRYREMPEGSYTTKLFEKGINKISQKVGEEAVETIIEAVGGTKDQFIYESSDLIYHLIVLLTCKGIRIEDLARELKARHKE
ncbi:MAG: phosphoribosyl-ATP diphosphatase [Prevotellaceae bacterium]|jgi:phosphoribosyl-ATP pyrophosphohydrolase/phosphoribosyl-AMP cyclohydrolase|nr:phosphoribosyl-ATP diphosphatase [Prevotellaceae bacterium]